MIKVVAAFISNNNKFLITKRAHGELKGKWEFPGGKINRGEEIFEAITREINEELGLKISPNRILGNFTHQYSFAKVNLTLIGCDLTGSNKIFSDGSHTDFKWITLGEIMEEEFASLDAKIVQYLKLHSN